MKPNRGSRPLRPSKYSKDGGKRHAGGSKGYRQRGVYSRSVDRGPKACPMCGEVVGDLASHMRDRHDDPASHPRE